MKWRFFLILLTTFSLLTSAAGRQHAPVPAQQDTATKERKQQPAAKGKNQDEIVRISVTLVQVDVSATDKKGRPIPDLKPEEFEVYEDGRRNDLKPGEYVLQLIVIDKLAKANEQVATDWVDFEIVR